eukprot:1678676-Pyramimonas_sp.AAC.1
MDEEGDVRFLGFLAGEVVATLGFDLEREASSVTAELVGIVWALVWTVAQAEVGGDLGSRFPVTIMSDSQVAIDITLGIN